ncbi:DUF4365 domain-containing protein [Dyella flagellata]|uniref:DUF4365 domain-containing protein n=1 Tax=Dyella flagellata TaxID=1867833 RepID=A0ABQ5XEK4_9GAMM|nr:DUF4365 domain-containing protein [Dyella flagellata]GLQ89038.1 hypothetical protein GCM10007898_26100 [Dyella flagellata]
MNFSANQKIGVLAEHSVESVFLSWSWTIGRDRIDVGYDLIVEPNQKQFNGHRFLVQIKGTASRKKGKVIAPVAKSRLRQYAVNPIPVFLIRQTADGTKYWLHVQPWAKENEKRLSGNGEAGVPMHSDQVLDDQDAFVSYLAEIFRPPPQQEGAVRELVAQRNRFLSSIDPHCKVRMDVINGNEHYEISSFGKTIKIAAQIDAFESQEKIAEMRDAMRYGLPVTLGLKAIQFTGSKLLDALGINFSGPGSLMIASALNHDGNVSLISGSKRSIYSKEFSIPSRIYLGHSGLGVTNEGRTGVVDFRLLADPINQFENCVNINIGIRGERLSESPLRHYTDLKLLGEWAGDTLEKGSMQVELTFGGKRALIPMPEGAAGEMGRLLVCARALGQLHEIARALNSDFTLSGEWILTGDEIDNIQLLYSVLRGERLEVTIKDFNFEIDNPSLVSDYTLYTIKTTMSLSIGGGSLGDVPVAFDLENYHIEPIQNSSKCRMLSVDGSKAYLYHQES